MKWVEIVQVADEFSASLTTGFYELFRNQGFGSDAPCFLFLGKVNNKPVATSRLFPAGGIAGIYHVATLPQARGRGYGTALTLAAANAGMELGYQVSGLFATQAGYRIYHRLGFQEVCTLDVYQSPNKEIEECISGLGDK
jgi:ribosomal protein S18 acetylase RimI-like enzyme